MKSQVIQVFFSLFIRLKELRYSTTKNNHYSAFIFEVFPMIVFEAIRLLRCYVEAMHIIVIFDQN